MPTSQVDVTTKSIDESPSQQNTTVTGALAFFRGTTVHPVTSIPNVSPSIKTTNDYDFLVSSVADAATATVTLASALAGDTVTINGLVYTAVTGAKADNTEFSIDGSDTVDAADLAASITADIRTGVIGDVIAESTVAIVTCTQTLGGTAGNATTIVSSDGGRLAVSGALFTGGTDGPVTVNIASRSITVAKSIGVPVSVSSFFTSLTDDATAAFFAIPKVNRDSNIEYDLIYTAVGAGAVVLDLNIVTLEVPIGATAPSFPVLPNITDPVQVFSVLRETTGLVKIYDYFMLSIP